MLYRICGLYISPLCTERLGRGEMPLWIYCSFSFQRSFAGLLQNVSASGSSCTRASWCSSRPGPGGKRYLVSGPRWHFMHLQWRQSPHMYVWVKYAPETLPAEIAYLQPEHGGGIDVWLLTLRKTWLGAKVKDGCWAIGRMAEEGSGRECVPLRRAA